MIKEEKEKIRVHVIIGEWEDVGEVGVTIDKTVTELNKEFSKEYGKCYLAYPSDKTLKELNITEGSTIQFYKSQKKDDKQNNEKKTYRQKYWILDLIPRFVRNTELNTIFCFIFLGLIAFQSYMINVQEEHVEKQLDIARSTIGLFEKSTMPLYIDETENKTIYLTNGGIAPINIKSVNIKTDEKDNIPLKFISADNSKLPWVLGTKERKELIIFATETINEPFIEKKGSVNLTFEYMGQLQSIERNATFIFLSGKGEEGAIIPIIK